MRASPPSVPSSCCSRAVPRWAPALIVAGLAGCLETEFELGPDAATAADASAADDIGPSADLGTDAVAQTDISTACPGGVGCSCAQDKDCTAGACVQTADGPRCTAPCTADAACPTGHTCGPPAAGAPSVCLPRFATACLPCTASSVCRGPADSKAACADATLSAGALGWYCAASCGQAADCPADSGCEETALVEGGKAKFCVPKSGVCACSPAAFSAKASTTCSKTTTGTGTCVGTRTCGAGGLSPCDAAAPVAETCNGKDDDCDGKTDQVSGPNPAQVSICDDGNGCTNEACDPAAGCKSLPGAATCSDGDPCTTGEACDGTKCVGAAPACNDGNSCTTDSCDAKTGACASVKVAAGACDDGDACTVTETCVDGECGGAKNLPCSDANECTQDLCDTGKGCVALAAPGTCTDADPCTADACVGGTCGATPLACNDGWACTVDACDAKKGCTFTPGGGAACADFKVPYSATFDCGGAAQAGWKPAPGPDADLPGAPIVRWQVDATPVLLPTQQSECALNANNGTDLACQPGQVAVTAVIDSPKIDASAVVKGTPLVVRFDSAGTWGTTWKADVQASTDDTVWIPLGAVAPSGSTWTTTGLSVAAFATTKFRVRLRLASPGCTEPGGSGWFVRKFKVAQDPCALNNGGCHADAACISNEQGAVGCTCKPGYFGTGKSCTDIDECTNGSAGCAASATCTNKPGSFSCGCPDGYAGDGKVCTDIDECTSGSATCHPNATCQNFKGGHLCTCKAGFSGNGTACQDIDECTTGKAGCAAAATCANSVGGFTCTCKTGWVGDGKTCAQVGTKEQPAASCLAIRKANPLAASGLWWLKAGPDTVQVHCDMVTDGGGWMRIDYAADLIVQAWLQKAVGFQTLAAPFPLALTTAQIAALQAVATEGRQTYVGQCHNLPHYYNAKTNGWDYAIGFTFADGTATATGLKSYAPHDVVVQLDSCKQPQNSPAPTNQTTFLIKSKKVPVVNISVRVGEWYQPKFGTPLKSNPAWLR